MHIAPAHGPHVTSGRPVNLENRTKLLHVASEHQTITRKLKKNTRNNRKYQSVIMCYDCDDELNYQGHPT